jgi:hypothetical protein
MLETLKRMTAVEQALLNAREVVKEALDEEGPRPNSTRDVLEEADRHLERDRSEVIEECRVLARYGRMRA